MKFRILASKINLVLVFAAVLFLISVNAVSIKKVVGKAFDAEQFSKLDDHTKREIFFKMCEQFIFAGGPLMEHFKECVDKLSATQSFYKSVSAKNMNVVLLEVGRKCPKENPTFKLEPQEAELFRGLGILTVNSKVEFAAIDKFIGQPSGEFTVNYKALNSV